MTTILFLSKMIYNIIDRIVHNDLNFKSIMQKPFLFINIINGDYCCPTVI